MLSSRKIGIFAILLTMVALTFVVFLHLVPETESEVPLGKIVYAEGQEVTFDKTDYYTDYTQESYYSISLEGETAVSDSNNVIINGGNITISSGGTYEISGTLSGGNITVDVQDDVLVRLVLAGADISSPSAPAIYIEQSKKTVISLAENKVNILSCDNEFTQTDADSAIYSKDDLVINGEGTLTINAEYADSVKCNDGLKITGGVLIIDAKDEGINANDYIVISDGDITVNKSLDAIKCENNDDAALGFIALEGGTINLNASDDGIYAGSDIYINKVNATLSAGGDAVHAQKNLILNGGSINIPECNEGFEGAYITVNGGDYTIIASDDALNATGENSGMRGRPDSMGVSRVSEIYLTVNGGKIYAEVKGDGIDSNSAAEINGGYIEIYGPENNGNSTLDFDGGFTINGGTVIAAGSSGMAERPSEISSQNTIVVTFSESYPAGTTFSIMNKSGETVVSGLSAKKFDWICVSTDKIKTGEDYTVYVNDSKYVIVSVSSAVTNSGQRSGGFGR